MGRDIAPVIATNFKITEFKSQDGSKLIILNADLVNRLQKLRSRLGKPIIINSGYRSEAHNKKVGGASKSYHLTGDAADISIKGMKVPDIAKAAEAVGFTGIIQYPKQNFVHVDVRRTPYQASV